MSEDTDNDYRERWERRYRQGPDAASGAARVLTENAHLLPAAGQALDLACGLGANALFMARRGLHTQAWDWSREAVRRLEAAAQGLTLTAQVRDVVQAPPEPRSFDVVVVSRFLERGLLPALANALRPGGLLFYQTFTRERVDDTGPNRPQFRLAENELLERFRTLRVLVYREEGRVGDCRRGFRNEALLVAHRPPAP